MMTLRETLDLVPDFRSSQGRRHSLGAILALATCAMLCGARSLYAIAQWQDQGGATAQLFGVSARRSNHPRGHPPIRVLLQGLDSGGL